MYDKCMTRAILRVKSVKETFFYHAPFGHNRAAQFKNRNMIILQTGTL